MHLPAQKLKSHHYKTLERTPGLLYAHASYILAETEEHLSGLYCCGYNLSSANKHSEQTGSLVITGLTDSSVLSTFLQFF